MFHSRNSETGRERDRNKEEQDKIEEMKRESGKDEGAEEDGEELKITQGPDQTRPGGDTRPR